MTKKISTLFVIFVALRFFTGSVAQGAEVFAKAALSKSNYSRTEYETSFSGSTGLAFSLFTAIKLEGRYIFRYSERNLLNYDSSTYLTNLRTAKNIYTVGLSIDILSEKHAVQPYIYLGGGYITSSSQFDFTSNGLTRPESSYSTQPSANGGLGFRVRVGRSIGFEIEAFGYAVDIDKPNPLIDWFASAGLRFYL